MFTSVLLRYFIILSEDPTVTLNNIPATISNSTHFAGTVPVTAGVNTVSVVAEDTNGNVSTSGFQTTVSGTAAVAPQYDYNGNLIQDAQGNAYTWDAKNELLSIAYAAGGSSSFSYDALGRRIKIVETAVGGAVTTKTLVWDGVDLAEERAGDGTTVTKRFFPQGEQIGGTSYLFTRDHLGSVRELTDTNGTVVSRQDYDPWGKWIPVSGSIVPDVGYAGMYRHQPSGLNLTLFRAYDPTGGRWLSRDPLGEGADSTLYSYVGNDPIDYLDPSGLGRTQKSAGNGNTASIDSWNTSTGTAYEVHLLDSNGNELGIFNQNGWLNKGGVHMGFPTTKIPASTIFNMNTLNQKCMWGRGIQGPLPNLGNGVRIGGSGRLFGVASVIPYLFGGGGSEDWGAIKAFFTGGPQGFMDYEQQVTDFYANQNRMQTY